MPHATGIDVGTTNPKVALIAGDGRLVATATRPITKRRAGDVAEQDPEALRKTGSTHVRPASTCTS